MSNDQIPGSAPRAALVLRINPAEIIVKPAHPRLCLDHVLIQFDDPLDALQSAIHGEETSVCLESYHRTALADAFRVRLDDPDFLKPIFRNASSNVDDQYRLRKPMLTVSLADGASRQNAAHVVDDESVKGEVPSYQTVSCQAEVLLLRPPSQAELNWLNAVGLKNLRLIKDYQAELTRREVRPQTPVRRMPAPRSRAEQRGAAPFEEKAGCGLRSLTTPYEKPAVGRQRAFRGTKQNRPSHRNTQRQRLEALVRKTIAPERSKISRGNKTMGSMMFFATKRFYATLTLKGENGGHIIFVIGYTDGKYETYDMCDNTVYLATPQEWQTYARTHIKKGYKLDVTRCDPFPQRASSPTGLSAGIRLRTGS